MAREIFEHKQLLAGEARDIITLPVAKGKYAIGDVVELVVTTGETGTTVAENYIKAAADAVIANDYAVCYENKEIAADGDTLVCVKQGYFNKNVLKINGAVASDESIKILNTKNIYVKDVTKY